MFTKTSSDTEIANIEICFTIPEPLNSLLVELKSEIKAEFGSFIYDKTAPHISLSDFEISETFIPEMITLLKKHLHSVQAVPAEVQGFEEMPWQNMVWAKLLDKAPFETTILALRAFRSEAKKRKIIKKANVVSPHLTVAKMFNKAKYEALLHFLKEVSLSSHFALDKILIQRAHEKGRKEVLGEVILTRIVQ